MIYFIPPILWLVCLPSFAAVKNHCEFSLQEFKRPTYHSQIAHLRLEGFHQIDRSDYFYRGGILVFVKPDAELELHTSICPELADRRNSLVAIVSSKTWDGYVDEVSLEPKKDLHVYVRSTQYRKVMDYHFNALVHGSSPSDPNDWYFVRTSKHVDQLLKAGFSLVEGTSSLYQKRLEDDRSRYSKMVFAVIKDGRIVQLTSPIKPTLRSTFKRPTDIIGFQTFSHDNRKDLSSIRFRQEGNELELTDEIFEGKIKKWRPSIDQENGLYVGELIVSAVDTKDLTENEKREFFKKKKRTWIQKLLDWYSK